MGLDLGAAIGFVSLPHAIPEAFSELHGFVRRPSGQLPHGAEQYQRLRNLAVPGGSVEPIRAFVMETRPFPGYISNASQTPEQ